MVQFAVYFSGYNVALMVYLIWSCMDHAILLYTCFYSYSFINPHIVCYYYCQVMLCPSVMKAICSIKQGCYSTKVPGILAYAYANEHMCIFNYHVKGVSL